MTEAGKYRPTPEEFEGIDAGLADWKAGRIASEEEVATVRRRFRGA